MKYGPAKPSRVQLNMAALDQVQQTIAQGCLKFLETIANEASARAPDAPPMGQGLLRNWGGAVYVNGKKVGNISADGSTTAKPREFRSGPGITGIVGFGFPGRFVEMGTSDTPSEPFLTPTAMSVSNDAVQIIRDAVAPLLAKP